MRLEVEYIPISELKPYDKNAKIHTPEQVKQIKKSIQDFGMNDPIAVWGEDNLIIEGHGRLMACKDLGYMEVPIIRLDDLTDEQRRAYTLIHNQTTMNTGFDIDILSEELENIDLDMLEFGFDMSDYSFSMDDIEESQGYDDKNDDRDYFEKTFTFPIEKKNQIICYLKKHQNEIVEKIIKESEGER